MLGVEAKKCLPALRLEVLYVMSLVENHVDPFLAPKDGLVRDRQLVGRDADVECMRRCPALPFLLPVLLMAVVRQGLETREKAFELHFPVEKHARWNDD